MNLRARHPANLVGREVFRRGIGACRTGRARGVLLVDLRYALCFCRLFSFVKSVGCRERRTCSYAFPDLVGQLFHGNVGEERNEVSYFGKNSCLGLLESLKLRDLLLECGYLTKERVDRLCCGALKLAVYLFLDDGLFVG